MAEELFKQAQQKQPSVTDVASRLKILEQRYANLTKREQLAEQNLLRFERDLRAELKALQSRMLETRRHLVEIKERFDTLQGSVANAVQRHELRELDAYLDMWQPIQFMTRAEAKKLLKREDVKREDEEEILDA